MTQPPEIFDRALLSRRLEHTRGDWISNMVAEDLVERLSFITRDIEKAAFIAPAPDALVETAATANGRFTFERFTTLKGASVDADDLHLPANDYQLIVSLLDLQVVNDVPGHLYAIRRHLAPDGLFIAAAIGGRSLTELRDAWLAADVELSGGVVPRVAPMIDLRDAGALLQRAGFALPVTDVETHTVRYGDPLALMQELKAMGAANPLVARHRGMTTPRRLLRAAQIYAEKFSDPDGKVRATLEILWLSGWAPHDSQQKPLKPGSATVNMRDILGDKSAH